MMKKIVSILAVLLLCASLTVSAFATTPSVTNPLAPEIVPVTDPDGNPAAGVIESGSGEIIAYIYYNPCLVVTPIAEAETSEHIPDDAEKLLLEIYDKLESGEMKLPYEKFDAGLDASKMVIRDMFDVTFLCEEHPEMLEEDGVTFRITFNLGVETDEDVYTMVYVDGEWNPAISTVNNGDGTVTCVFEEVCPVVFCVEGEEDTPVNPPVQTGDPVGEDLVLWASAAAISIVAVAVLTVFYVRGRKKED